MWPKFQGALRDPVLGSEKGKGRAGCVTLGQKSDLKVFFHAFLWQYRLNYYVSLLTRVHSLSLYGILSESCNPAGEIELS